MDLIGRLTERRVIREGDIEFDDDVWDEIYPVLKEYAQILDVTIHVSRHDGEAVDPRGGGQSLYIRFDTLPEEVYSTSMDRLYGVALRHGQTEVMFPTEGGSHIMDPDGITVAQVFNSTLYVLFDLPSYEYNAAYLMRKIMEGYVDLKNGVDPFAEVPTDSVANMLAMHQASVNIEIRALVERREKTQNRALQYERALAELNTELTKTDKELKAVKKAAKEALPEVAAQKLEALAALSSDGRVVVTDRYIRLNLGQIDVTQVEESDWDDVPDETHTYDIGEFLLYIYPDGSHGYVRCVNLTRIVGGDSDERCYHPHVLSNGDCCLGNISEIIKKLVLAGDYEMTVQMVKMFLTKIDEDAGVYLDVSEWPEKK